ncbi:DUF305 domain-containing protein [Streptosporangium subroseum]|uniref:DUF305 domain-containing protein n=1 Tax=Streptosporangium subroseum TaxID=106412 RepID=UPI00308649BB|nr:DUF305 domain-containing protein [Streptosporangium subroseum]
MIWLQQLSRRHLTVAGATVLVIAVAAFGLGVLRPWPPADTSAEAGFARDMQAAHHAQAVRMSMIVRDRTSDAETQMLAYDIALSQQQQIGQIYAWLEMWALPQASLDPPMAWMRRGHQSMTGMKPQGLSMPGMATAAQLRQLEQANKRKAEVLFLQLKIPHHRGGVQMAQAALNATDQPQVRRLAASIVAAQNSELDLMRRMLTARGASDALPAG